MSNFFKADNWFFTGVTKLVLLIVVNAMFVICSIPIFTFGASYSGLYYAINKNLKFDRGYAFKSFFTGFKGSFKNSTLATILFLLITMIFAGDIAVLKTFGEMGRIPDSLFVIFIVLTALVWLYAIWVFTYTAVFENTLKNTLKNSLIMFFLELPTTLYAALILTFVGVIIYISYITILIMPGVGVWLISHRMQKSFRKYMTEEQREKEDEMNDMKAYSDKKLFGRKNK